MIIWNNLQGNSLSHVEESSQSISLPEQQNIYYQVIYVLII